jgi:hypothetical protein
MIAAQDVQHRGAGEEGSPGCRPSFYVPFGPAEAHSTARPELMGEAQPAAGVVPLWAAE